MGRDSGTAMQWVFEDCHNVAVVTLRSIISRASPILRVSHDGDGCWQFLSLGAPEEEEAVVVSLADIVSIDPTVRELAELP